MNIEPGSIFGKGAGERKRGRGFWWVRYFRGPQFFDVTFGGSLLSEVYGSNLMIFGFFLAKVEKRF